MATQRDLEIQLVKKAQERGMTPDKIKEAVVQFRAQKGATTQAPAVAPAQPTAPQGATGIKGFGAGILKGIGSTLAGAEKLGGKILDLPLKALGIQPAVPQGLLEIQKDKGTFTPTTTSQKIGYGAEQLGELLLPIPGGAKAKLATKAAEGLKGILGRGALEAGELGLKTSVQTGGDVEETGRAATLGGAFGAGGALFSRALGKAAPALTRSAEKGMTQALGPTTKAMTVQAEKVVPELVQRGFKGFSRADLAKQAAASLEKAGESLDDVLKTIHPGTRINAKPILKALQDAKAAYMVDGVVIEPRAVKAFDEMAKTLKEFGSKVSFESMRNLRQTLDKAVAKSKGFLMDEASTFSIEAKREATNAIRRELAKKFPDLAKVNAEFTLWKRVDDILGETMTRTTAQAPGLSSQILKGAGFAGGLASGGISGGVTWAIVMTNLQKALQSAAWKTVSAVTKNRLAQALAAGRFEEASAILGKIIASFRKP